MDAEKITAIVHRMSLPQQRGALRNIIAQAIVVAVEAEREQCAKVAETSDECSGSLHIAAFIRARSKGKG